MDYLLLRLAKVSQSVRIIILDVVVHLKLHLLVNLIIISIVGLGSQHHPGSLRHFLSN